MVYNINTSPVSDLVLKNVYLVEGHLPRGLTHFVLLVENTVHCYHGSPADPAGGCCRVGNGTVSAVSLVAQKDVSVG